jgi:hypothetical protein
MGVPTVAGSKLVIIAAVGIEVGFSGTHESSLIQDVQVARMIDALVSRSIPMDPFEGEIVSAELHTYTVVEEE